MLKTMEKGKRQKSNTNLNKVSARQAKADLSLLPSNTNNNTNFNSNQHRHTNWYLSKDNENIKSRSPQYRKPSNKIIPNLKPRKASGASGDPLKDIINKPSGASEAIKQKVHSRLKKISDKSPFQEQSDKSNHNALINGRSAESNESRESKKRNQKIQAKQEQKSSVYLVPPVEELGATASNRQRPGPKREQMIYLEKKDLATDASLKYFQQQQSVYSIPTSGHDCVAGLHGTSISSFLGMSEEKQLKKRKIEEDQMKRIEILEMDGDKVINYEPITTNSQLYEQAKKGPNKNNNQHLTYCFFENTNQSQSHAQLEQIPQNKTFNDNQPRRNLQESTFDHEEQDEIDLLMCSERATDINIMNDQSNNQPERVEQTLSLRSPFSRRKNKQQLKDDFLSFNKERKYEQHMDTASPLNIRKQDDSANLCTALVADDYTANKQELLSPVGDFQQMINDHTELFQGNVASPQNDQIANSALMNFQIQREGNALQDLDQDLELDVKKPKDNQKRQIITNLKQGNQNSTSLVVSAPKYRLTSRSSNRSQEYSGFLHLNNSKQSSNNNTQNGYFSPSGPGLQVPNFEKLKNTKTAFSLNGRRNSAANQPYRSLSLNTINFKYSSNCPKSSMELSMGHNTLGHTTQNSQSLRNHYLTTGAGQQNQQLQTQMSNKSGSKTDIMQRPMIKISGATIKKSPIFQNQKDIQMALIHSLVLDQKSPIGRPLQITKIQDNNCKMLEQNDSNNSQNKKSGKLSSTKSNFSLQINTRCQYGQKALLQLANPSSQANGPLKEQFQDMTLSEARRIQQQDVDYLQKSSDKLSNYMAPSSSSASASSHLKSQNNSQSYAKSSRMRPQNSSTIEKLKSPKGNPMPPINKNNLMDLLNDALDGQYDTDDDKPFDPYQNRMQSDEMVESDPNEKEIANIIAEDLALERQDKSSQKAADLQPVQSGSERLTDLGDSPDISPQQRQLALKNQQPYYATGSNGIAKDVDEQDCNILRLNSKQNYYDPHEPHSAQDRRLINAERKMYKRQSSMKNGGKETSPELLNFKDDQSPSNSPQGPSFDRMNQLNKFLGENDEFLKKDDDGEEGFMKLENVQEQDHHNSQAQGNENMIDDMVLYDNDLNILYDHHQSGFQKGCQQFKHGEQSEEVGLIDDGFFDNLMMKQSKKDTHNVIKEEHKQTADAAPNLIKSMELNSQDTKLYGTFDFTQANMRNEVSLGNQFSQFVKRESDQLLSSVERTSIYPENLNILIRENVKNSYFPQATQNLEFFEQMLIKEQKINQFNHLNPQINWQNLFERQTELSLEMRVILLDWLCQVSSDYCLKRQTYHLSIQFVDAYFQRCQNHIPKSEFQLIGITCLHMAAKIEEIYPPHINSFAESTNDSVTPAQIIAQEYKVCNQLNWNFEQFITSYTWATWFMKRWDEYVDESLSYLKQQFQLKFFENTRESNQKFLTFMQFVDILSLSFESKQFTQRMVVACIMYLILGGKNIMCAFQIDYRDMLQAFTEQFPIVDPTSFNQPNGDIKANRIPEGILFYNQIIQPFFVKEFGLYLHEMIEPLKFVLKFLILDIDEGSTAPYGLIQQCKCTLKQHREIVLEKVFVLQEEISLYGSMHNVDCIRSFKNHSNITEFTDEDVYFNVNEFFSYQTYNSSMLDTLKFIQNLHLQPNHITNSAGAAGIPDNRCTIDGLNSESGVRLGSRPTFYDIAQLDQDDNEELRNRDTLCFPMASQQITEQTSMNCNEVLIDNSLAALEKLDNLNFDIAEPDHNNASDISYKPHIESYSNDMKDHYEQNNSNSIVISYQDSQGNNYQ